jgi:hypothetical protein
MRMEAAHTLLEASTGRTVEQKIFAIATLGSAATTLLTDLLAPVSLSDGSVTYVIIKSTLSTHLQGQKLEMAERAVFYTTQQRPGETVASFFSRLKKASEHCNFCASLETMLRDRLVLGCTSCEAKKKLLAIHPLSLKTVQDTLTIFEAVESAKGNMGMAETTDTHFLDKGKKFQKSGEHSMKQQTKYSADSNRQCDRCGNSKCSGKKDECPAYGRRCTGCGKTNHFKKVCRQPTINAVHEEQVMHLSALPAHQIASHVTVQLGGKEAIMEIDTGAAATIISDHLWRSLGSPTLSPSGKLFTAYDGHRIAPLGEWRCSVKYGDKVVDSATVTVVLSTKFHGLLGRDLLGVLSLAPSLNLHQSTAYPLPLPLMKVPPASIQLVEGVSPTFSRARPVPLPLLDKVNQHIKDLESRGIIKPVTSSRFASPVVWVRKADGTLRMCVDFKQHINVCIKSDAYPLPAMETIFAGMENAQAFAKLDLKEAYWQIPLDRASREICTINTTKGLYQMTRLPKGMKNSSAIFQRIMEDILRDLKGVVIFQDDIFIHAPSRDCLARRVSSVLKRLEEKHVTINTEKSVMFSESLSFLGHLVTPKGIQPDPQIAEKILSCQPPRDRKELESFLGLINFFGKMIPKFAALSVPLNQLRRKDVPYAWSTVQQEAFDALLQSIASPEVLRSYSLSEEATLTTDASEAAIAGVLSQNGRPVMFISRMLTAAEKNYSNVEREGLAVVWSVLRLRQFLLGRHFTLVTDHQPLQTIYGGSSLPKVASARLARWAITLQSFDYTVQYRPGSALPHVDAISRLRFNSDASAEEDIVINNVWSDAAIPEDLLQRVRALLPADKTAAAIIHRVKTQRWSDCSQRERPFLRARQTLRVEDDMLFCGTRLFIPATMCKEVFDHAHQLHSGISSTLRHLSLNVWWPGMKRDVQNWVSSCSLCSQLRPRTAKDKNHWPVSAPFERIHADWCYTHGVGNILLLVDASSGWIEAFPQPHRTSSSIIAALSDLSSRFGVPKTFVTDNGPEFISEEVNQWCAANGVEKMESPPYHPASNGVAERGVQTVKRSLRAWKLDSTHLPFGDYLKRVLLHHRACCRRRDGRTPAEIVFGRTIRLPLSAAFGFGDSVIYRPNDTIPPTPLTFLMNRGSNTSWLLDEMNGRLRLAHSNQIAPTASSALALDSGTDVTSDVEQVSPASSLTSSASAVPPVPPLPTAQAPTSPTRCSSRMKKPKAPMDYEDL